MHHSTLCSQTNVTLILPSHDCDYGYGYGIDLGYDSDPSNGHSYDFGCGYGHVYSNSYVMVVGMLIVMVNDMVTWCVCELGLVQTAGGVCGV